jgi:hypothetical protein
MNINDILEGLTIDADADGDIDVDATKDISKNRID